MAVFFVAKFHNVFNSYGVMVGERQRPSLDLSSGISAPLSHYILCLSVNFGRGPLFEQTSDFQKCRRITVFTAFAYIGQFNSRPRIQNEPETEKSILPVRSLGVGNPYIVFRKCVTEVLW